MSLQAMTQHAVTLQASNEHYTPDEARNLLEEELADPRYQDEHTGPLRQAIGNLITWLEENAVNIGPLNVPMGPLILLALIIVSLIVLLVIVRPRLQRSARVEESVDISPDLSAEDLRASADQHAAAAEYDDAARQRFRALVRSAEERSLLHRQRGRTPSEVATSLANQFPDSRPELLAAAELFNLSRYGGRALTAEQHERIRDLDQALSGMVPHPPTEGSDIGTPRLEAPR